MREETDYIKEPVTMLYRKLAPSAIGSMLTATVASLIDVVILSHYLGPEMLAVVELCMPLYMLMNTVGMLIASGSSTLYAQHLGSAEPEEAQRYFSASVDLSVWAGFLMMAVGLIFTKQIVSLLGANDAVFRQTMEYAHVLFFFMVPTMFYILLLFFVRIDNDPNRTILATLVCAVVNLVLDILFVGPLQWGPRGAALATCLAYSIGMLFNATHFLSKKNTLKWFRGSLPGRWMKITKAGIPLAASQLGMTVTTNVFNNRIIRVGNESYVSVYAVITQLSMTAMAIYEGIGQAAQPILAAAFGAADRKRLREAFRVGLRLELVGTFCLMALYMAAAGGFAWLLSIRGGELLSLTLKAIRIYALSVPLFGCNCLIMYLFQAQNKTKRALLISLLSGSVFMIAALLVLTAVFGVEGIWYSWICAQALSLVVSLSFAIKEQK
ncbi:MAG: MATE family efflux transporter, partial [Clostridia bacterium]|nr:MATE family efflux transporter [Clostridia bacterium]